MKMKTVSIAKDFSCFPAGKDFEDGRFSGSHCRIHLLLPALNTNDQVTVCLDGTMGYGSSFLEGAFGGLVRVEGFTSEDLHHRLNFISNDDPTLITEIWSYIDKADEKSIFDLVMEERKRQDDQWGGIEHDQHHHMYDWTTYIEKQLNCLRNGTSQEEYKERLVKIAALSVAALETIK